MTKVEAWPDAGSPFTVAELDRMPDDGRRYELLGGGLVISQHPGTAHQYLASRLAVVLDGACPEEFCVVPAPALQIDSYTEFVPDLVVVRLDQMSGAKITEPPLLAVEVRSPATALIDLNRKKSAYEEFGIPSYWVVDPNPERTELTVFELRDGHYETEAKAVAPVTLARPFGVTVDPASLTRKLRR